MFWFFFFWFQCWPTLITETMDSDTGSVMSFSLVLIITVFHHHCLLSSLKTKSHIEILSSLLTIKKVKIAAIGINQFLVFPLFCMEIIVSKLDWGKKYRIIDILYVSLRKKKTVCYYEAVASKGWFSPAAATLCVTFPPTPFILRLPVNPQRSFH